MKCDVHLPEPVTYPGCQAMQKKSPVPGRGDGLDLRRALDLVMQLMAIPGPSGQEDQVATFIRKQLRAAGAPAPAIKTDSANRRTLIAGDIGNLVFKLPGTVRGPRRFLSAHLDTVPICVGSRPKRKGGTIHSQDNDTGLGADNRAGCAVLLCAALEILERRLPHPPLTFCWFVQEEIGLQGARTATRSLWGRPKLAFNWDGGSPVKLTVGATGGYRLQIDIQGRASHAGGAPQKGVSAIAIAALAVADLHRSGWHGDVQQGGKQGTSNVGVIHGGAATNVVTDRTQVRAEARSHDPVFRKRILREIESAFRRAAKEVRSADGRCGQVRITSQLDYESFLLRPDEPCVKVAEAAIRAIGREPLHAVANGGVDANWITHHGIPSVSLGCGQKDQHTTRETLDVANFEDACRIGLCLATASERA